MSYKTDHLVFDYGFVSIVDPKWDGDSIDCGRITPRGRTTCEWPETLGPEPYWFQSELDVLCEAVKTHFDQLYKEDLDYRAQVDADYLRGKGAK